MNYCIYPYSNELSSLVKHINTNTGNINIVGVVYPFLQKHNLNLLDGVELYDDIKQIPADIDGIIFCESEYLNENYSQLIDNIKLYLLNEKLIICCASLEKKDYETFLSQKNFVYLGKMEHDITEHGEICQKTDCVIVGVGKIINELDTQNTVVSLYEMYTSLGYKVSVLSTNCNNRLIGFYDYPLYIFSSYHNELDKILALNALISKIDNTDTPDIVLIELPYGLFGYAPEANHFGIYSYIISQACSVDYFILQTGCDLFDENSINELYNSIKYRFGWEINAVLVEDKIVDVEESNEVEEICFVRAESSVMQKNLSMWMDVIPNTHAINNNETTLYQEIANDSIQLLSCEFEEV